MRFFFVLLMLGLISACTLPRGAALQSEILAGSKDANPSFSVVPVTRAALPDLLSWPATGWSGGYNWLNATRTETALPIKAGDTIDLVVWDSQENSLLTSGAQKTVDIKGLRVSPKGMIFMPYIDEIAVAGLTPEQARNTIQAKLEPIVASAQVQLFVTAGNGNTVDLVSGVAKPGRYPLPDRSFSILSLLSDGGGISTALRNPIVRLQRDGRSYTIPASDLFASPSLNTVLRGGDRVVVEQDGRYFVALGATGKEELVYFTKNEISTLDALSLIGGLADSRANLKGVMVLREYPASTLRADGSGPAMRQVVFTFDLTSVDGLFAARTFRINPEDVVLATESPIPSINSIFALFRASIGISNQL